MSAVDFGDFSDYIIYDPEHYWPQVRLAPGWWFCRECGRPMQARFVSDGCCDTDWHQFCVRCDPPDMHFGAPYDSARPEPSPFTHG